MNNDKELEQLRQRMEGKRVLKVEPPNAPEAIAKFTMEDGKVFILHATDLGFWITDTAGSDDIYPSLTSMLEAYYHYTYPATNTTPNAYIFGDEMILVLITPAITSKEFKVKLSSLTTAEQEIFVKREDGVKLLCECADLGDCWSMGLEKSLRDMIIKERDA